MASTIDRTIDTEIRTKQPSRGYAWAGLAFVPAFLVGFILANSTPDTSTDTNATWIAWFNDRSHQVQGIAGAIILSVAGILLLAFVAGVGERLMAARQGAPVTHRFSQSAGVLAAGVLMISAVESAGIIGNIAFGSQPVPQDADIMRSNFGGVFVALIATLLMACFITGSTIMAKRLGLFGSAMTTFSYVMAFLLLFGVLWFPMIALPLWMLVASIALLRERAA
jgi:hypothetical protein